MFSFLASCSTSHFARECVLVFCSSPRKYCERGGGHQPKMSVLLTHARSVLPHVLNARKYSASVVCLKANIVDVEEVLIKEVLISPK